MDEWPKEWRAQARRVRDQDDLLVYAVCAVAASFAIGVVVGAVLTA